MQSDLMSRGNQSKASGNCRQGSPWPRAPNPIGEAPEDRYSLVNARSHISPLTYLHRLANLAAKITAVRLLRTEPYTVTQIKITRLPSREFHFHPHRSPQKVPPIPIPSPLVQDWCQSTFSDIDDLSLSREPRI